MDTKAFERVKNNFYLKREEKIKMANLLKDEIYDNNETLKKLEETRNIIALKITRNILNNKDKIESEIEEENMQQKLASIDKKIELEYKKIGITKEMLLPKFDCKKCSDTGMIKNGDKIIFCSCFTQAVINETYKQINMLKIKDENFETFDIGFYSSEVNREKYGINKSPRENIEQIRDISLNFACNIKNKDEKNLLFIGNTGLGKTFLSNAIAKMVIDNGYSVIYQTAPVFIDKIMQYKFSYNKEEKKDLYNKIFEVDLLIIDDLGTETMTNNKYTELFNIINTRLLSNKKIIISTNLKLNELFSRYDERIISRLIGEFKICKFVGEDILLKKKRISKDTLN